MNKIITPDLSKKDDPEWVKNMNAFLEEHISKKQRQDAKAKLVGPLVGDGHSKEQLIARKPKRLYAWSLAAEPIDGQTARCRKVHRLVQMDVESSDSKHSCSGMSR